MKTLSDAQQYVRFKLFTSSASLSVNNMILSDIGSLSRGWHVASPDILCWCLVGGGNECRDGVLLG